MKKEFSNAIISYSDSEENVDFIYEYFSNKSQEILRFFNIEIKEKVIKETPRLFKEIENYYK
jgi:hypothetical protein